MAAHAQHKVGRSVVQQAPWVNSRVSHIGEPFQSKAALGPLAASLYRVALFLDLMYCVALTLNIAVEGTHV